MERNTCPIQGCEHPVAAGKLMCLGHWRLVPAAIRARVWARFRAYRRGGTLAPLRAAQRAAVEAVQREEKLR